MVFPPVLRVLILSLGLIACSNNDSSESNPAQNDPSLANQAPTVDIGDDITVVIGVQTTIAGNVSDDGLPGSGLSYIWEQVSGPGTVQFGAVNSESTTAVFDTVGSYSIQLTVNDGELTANDVVGVTVTASTVTPSDQQLESGVKEHSSGLRLEFDPDSVLQNSTDIDWMFRLWGGIVSCQGGANVPYPSIRLVDSVTKREDGDLMFDEEGASYKWNYDKQLIEIINTDTAISKGPDQGLLLGEAVSVYLGFYKNDNFPDPGSRNGFRCNRWHAGGRWKPSPTPPDFAEPAFLQSVEAEIGGASIAIKSDTNAVDSFSLSRVGELYQRLYECHAALGAAPMVVNEIWVVSGRSADFHGDRWSDTGAYAVENGGRILIDSSDLEAIRSNENWGTNLYDWINLYLDASRNGPNVNLECRDRNGIYFDPILPLDLDK